MPKIEILPLHHPRPEGVMQRLMQSGHRLNALHVFSLSGDSSHPSQADYAAMTLMPGLRNVTVLGRKIRLTGTRLQLLAEMPNLQSFDFNNDSKEINRTPEGVATFRERRPNVHLRINNQDYPTHETLGKLLQNSR